MNQNNIGEAKITHLYTRVRTGWGKKARNGKVLLETALVKFSLKLRINFQYPLETFHKKVANGFRDTLSLEKG